MGYPTQYMEWEKGVKEEGRGEIKMGGWEGRWSEGKQGKWSTDQEILAHLLSASLSSPSEYLPSSFPPSLAPLSSVALPPGSPLSSNGT